MRFSERTKIGSQKALLQLSVVVTITGVCLAGGAFAEEAAPLSEATETCLVCHAALNPGIVGDWERSRHARITPAEALKKEEEELHAFKENTTMSTPISIAPTSKELPPRETTQIFHEATPLEETWLEDIQPPHHAEQSEMSNNPITYRVLEDLKDKLATSIDASRKDKIQWENKIIS